MTPTERVAIREAIAKLEAALGADEQSRCGIAERHTVGTYICTREAGHGGPCAMVATREAEADHG